MKIKNPLDSMWGTIISGFVLLGLSILAIRITVIIAD